MWARGRARSWFLLEKKQKMKKKKNEKIVNKKSGLQGVLPEKAPKIYLFLYRNVSINRAPIKAKHSEKKGKMREQFKTSKHQRK